MTQRTRHGRLILALLTLAGCVAGAAQADALAAHTHTGTTRGAADSRYVRWNGMIVESLGYSRGDATAVAGDLSAGQAPQTIALSNERTSTTSAMPAYPAAIYSGPNRFARHVDRLHMYTEDRFPEVYLLLREHINSSGHRWIELRIPGRPNGQTGWVRRGALGAFHTTHWLLVVDRGANRLTAYFDGRRRFTAPVGVGKPTTPTPSGHFWIRESFRILDRSSGYWPYAMGTSDYSTLSDWPGGGVVGIHGDLHAPWLIPGDPSHGCIRLHDPDDAWVATHVPVGTPVHVV
ncbi:MAG TPA: L,D-transpeptidase [Solirubrobacteraceae bacterium]|jgi:hypothetical protein